MQKDKLPSKNIFIIGGAAFGILCIVAIIFFIIELQKTAKLVVSVAPESAEVLINGKSFKNGDHKLFPGDYTVSIQKSGFDPYETKFTVKDGDTYKLFMCLNSEDKNYYKTNLKDADLCEAYNNFISEQASRDLANSDPIFKITPYYNYADSYTIDAEWVGDKVKINVKSLACNNTFKEYSIEKADEWLNNNLSGLDKYEIEYIYLCSDADDTTMINPDGS